MKLVTSIRLSASCCDASYYRQ